jgi:hypothetical protein
MVTGLCGSCNRKAVARIAKAGTTIKACSRHVEMLCAQGWIDVEEPNPPTYHVKCQRCGHEYDVPPIIGSAGNVAGYSSIREFCDSCERPLADSAVTVLPDAPIEEGK